MLPTYGLDRVDVGDLNHLKAETSYPCWHFCWKSRQSRWILKEERDEMRSCDLHWQDVKLYHRFKFLTAAILMKQVVDQRYQYSSVQKAIFSWWKKMPLKTSTLHFDFLRIMSSHWIYTHSDFYCPGSTQFKSSYELNQSVLSCIDCFMIGRGHQVLLTR